MLTAASCMLVLAANIPAAEPNLAALAPVVILHMLGPRNALLCQLVNQLLSHRRMFPVLREDMCLVDLAPWFLAATSPQHTPRPLTMFVLRRGSQEQPTAEAFQVRNITTILCYCCLV